MSWVRIDDHFATHPKVLAAGPLAAWLHMSGLCYASLHLTDGFIPRAAIATLAAFDGVGLTREGQLIATPLRVDPHDLVGILVAVGLWDEAADGYRIHDYLDYNPARSAVEQKREHIRFVRTVAGRKSGVVRRVVRRDRAMGTGVGEQRPNKPGNKR